MAAKHWLGALTFLTMAAVSKAHMIFIRLVILAAAGLAGLFLLHILAQDYRKIQSSRPKAFGLFKRSIQLQDAIKPTDSAYSPDVIQPISEVESNSLSLLSIAVKLDPNGCARRYICSLAARPTPTLSTIEKSLLDLVQTHKDGVEFREAAYLGRKTSGAPEQCATHFPRCTFSITEMLRLIQPVY